MPFEVTVHPGKDILEIVYPEAPTLEDVAAYGAHIRRLLQDIPGGWASLVDQRKLKSMPMELLRAISALNAFAQSNRMERSARIVADDAAGMSSWRITRRGGVKVPIRSFETREEALAWLQESAAATRRG